MNEKARTFVFQARHLRALLEGLDDDANIMPQVIAVDGTVWQMQMTGGNPPTAPDVLVLTMRHPYLLTLPKGEE